jgi:uncharacterized RDD family membrane protein YckC
VGFGPRFGAWLLDIVFVVIVVGIAFFASLDVSLMDLVEMAKEDPIAYANYIQSRLLVPTLISFAYTSVEILTGASPAKWMLGLRVAKQDGQPGTSREYVLRGLVKSGPSVLGVFAVMSSSLSFLSDIGGLWNLAIFFGCFVALGEKKQALHDIICKTAVFKRTDIGNIPQGQDAEV